MIVLIEITVGGMSMIFINIITVRSISVKKSILIEEGPVSGQDTGLMHICIL